MRGMTMAALEMIFTQARKRNLVVYANDKGCVKLLKTMGVDARLFKAPERRG